MKKKLWEKPEIWTLGVEKTEMYGKGEDGEKWIICPQHGKVNKNHPMHEKLPCS